MLDTAVRNNLIFVRDCLESRTAASQNENEKSDDPSGDGFDREKAHRKAGDFAKECAVLLKNDGMLPLLETQKVAFIGEFAEQPRFQGSGSSHIHVSRPVSPLDAIDGQNITYAKGYSLNDTDNNADSLLAQAVETARNADAAVIFAGLPDAYVVRKIRKRTEADIVLLTPNGDVPSPRLGIFESTTSERVKVIRELAVEEKVCLVDVYSIWEEARKRSCPWPELLSNGANHPGVEGHEAYAIALMKLFEG